MQSHRVVGKLVAAIAVLASALSAAAQPITTGFTFQGRLDQAGSPVNQTADFRFSLWTLSAGGSQIGSTLGVNNLDVIDGLFTVELDFGAAALNGDQRWLEIEVRSPAGAGVYDTLDPRQLLTGTPYALQTRGMFVSEDDNIAIGFASNPPFSKVHILSEEQRALYLRRNGSEDAEPVYVLDLAAQTDGTPQAGFGSRITMRAESSNGGLGQLAQIDALTLDPATNNFKGDLVFRTAEPGSPNTLPERMRITNDGRVFVGRDARLSSSEYFGVRAPVSSGFGGMYMETQGAAGQPFYGYSANGDADAWHYYHGSSNSWFLNIDGVRLTVDGDTGNVGIGDTTPDARLDVVAGGGDGITVSASGSGDTALSVTATSDATGISITHTTNNQNPALEIDASGDAQPILVSVDASGGDIANIASMSLTGGSTSVAPAFDVDADTVGPVARFESTNAAHNSAALVAVNPGSGSAAYAIHAVQSNAGSDTAAIRGENQNEVGDGAGVVGIGGWRGVFGQATTGGGGTRTGVYGAAVSASTATHYGIFGWALNGATNWAGWFSGNVNVTGTLSKGGGSFKIDHPLDPENKYLYHSFVESPDMMNIYNGNIITDARGYAQVTMPDWFDALNRDFRYQLTVIGQFAQAIVAEEMKNRRFTIRTDKPNVKVSWQVTGIRQDEFANAHRIPVEQDKPEEERGSYLHPELFGQPASLSVERVLDPALNAELEGE